MEHESSARAKPKATHEVVVIRASGERETVQPEKRVSDEKAQALFQMLKRRHPELGEKENE